MKRLFAILGLMAASAQAQTAPTVTLTASPTSGNGSVTPTLTWSSTGATTCTASGGWTGTKALSGTETVAATTVTKTYTLTCSVPDGSATVSWAAPTTNTDGTPLTNLAGFKVYHALTSAGVATAVPTVINSPTTTTFSATGLAVGTHFYGATAFNTLGAESALSNIGSKAITSAGLSGAASATVTVGSVPSPPSNLTIAVIVGSNYQPVYRPFFDPMRSFAPVLVGLVPVGTQCYGPVVFKYRGATFRRIPSTKVLWWSSPILNVAAACG
jgi:hypothetical protein